MFYSVSLFSQVPLARESRALIGYYHDFILRWHLGILKTKRASVSGKGFPQVYMQYIHLNVPSVTFHSGHALDYGRHVYLPLHLKTNQEPSDHKIALPPPL